MHRAINLVGNEVIWYLKNHRRPILDDQFHIRMTKEILNYTFKFVFYYHYLEVNKLDTLYFSDHLALELTAELEPEGFTLFESFEAAFALLSREEPYFTAEKYEILSRIKLRNKAMHQFILILSD